jgi:CRP-like cAMP-binding protein
LPVKHDGCHILAFVDSTRDSDGFPLINFPPIEVFIVHDPSQKTLAGVPLLKELPELVRQRYEGVCMWKSCQPDQEIIGRESGSRDVFFVVEGTVRIVNYSFSGREVSYEDIGPGQLFGELAAIDGKPRSASVVSLDESLLAMMPAGAFLKLVTENPPIGHAMMQRLAEVIRASTDRIMDLSTVGAHNRVYAELLRLARPNLEESGRARISPIPVHADIAARVSTTRESVARAVSELIKKKLVERVDDGLLILDFLQLEDIVLEFRNY